MNPGRQPALFLAHGAPDFAIERSPDTAALAALGASLSPAAIVLVSAHWETRGAIGVNAAERPGTLHDFGGFAPELHRMHYAAPGDPALAARVAERLAAAGLSVAVERERGWDHGVWVPLSVVFPRAEVPVVEISVPGPHGGELLLAAGSALAELRGEGILLVGSGGIVHNLRRLKWEGGEPEEWAVEFDGWARARAAAHDREGLLAYRSRPSARLAVPTPEHFEPLFFALGAAERGEPVVDVVSGIRMGALSMRSLRFG